MGNRRDLTGQRFGRLTVIKEAGRSKQGHCLWLCHCDCGNEVVAMGSSLFAGYKRSCGCLEKIPKSAENLVGKKFGRLTVIEKTQGPDRLRVYWRCQCDCGQMTIVTTNHLKSGHTKSCGCLYKESKHIPNQLDRIEGSRLSYWNNDMRIHPMNNTGIRGIIKLPNGRYRVQIKFQGKKVINKRFDTLEDAKKARQEAWDKYIKPYLEEHTPKVEKKRKDVKAEKIRQEKVKEDELIRRKVRKDGI